MKGRVSKPNLLSCFKPLGMKKIFLLCCVSLCFTCQPNKLDVEKEKEAIMAASNAFSQAYINGNLEKQMSYYTEDVVIISGNRPMIQGKEAVTQYWTLPESVKVLEHRSISSKLEINGNLATDYGIYEGKSLRNGDTTSFRGQYVITWRKEADRQWRMSIDMWASLNN